MTILTHPFSEIAFCGEALFLLIVFALHFLKPDLDPNWRMVSEYARDKYGWLMRIAFYSSAIACFALVVALWPFVPLFDSFLLLIVGTGALGAGIFVTDPITRPPNSISRTSRLHVFFSALFILGLPFAATAIDWSLRGYTFAGRFVPLPLLTCLVWVGCISYIVASIKLAGKSGEPVPGAGVGWWQRFMIVTHASWILLIAFSLFG